VTVFDDPDVCELAGLYSLGALDAADAWRFRAHLLDGCGACRDEVAAFEDVAVALAYAAAPVAPSPILRERVLDAIAEPAAQTAEPPFVGPAGDWEPYAIPGVTVRRLFRDEANRQTVMLVRAEPGVRYPAHRHAALEEMFMLEGELRFGETVYRPGDYIRSECGSLHGSSETLGGCMFLIRASLDNELML
jgi:anti-sigma factor ChrR (cupin superfamily)